MSSTDRHLSSLMRQIATRDEVELVHPFAEWRTFGALAYVAESYGFRYAGVRLIGKQRVVHVTLVRDTSPWARQRAAADTAASPDPGAGRPVPGMYLGSLTPVPEARPDVELLTTLIRHEALEAAVNRRQPPAMAWGFAALFLLMAPLTGKYAVLLPLAVLTPLGLLGALRVNASRRAKPARQLVAAGCTAVPDGSGRVRHTRPTPHTV